MLCVCVCACVCVCIGSSIIITLIAILYSPTLQPFCLVLHFVFLQLHAVLFREITDMSHELKNEAAVVKGMGAGVVPVTVTEATNRAVVFIDTRYV